MAITTRVPMILDLKKLQCVGLMHWCPAGRPFALIPKMSFHDGVGGSVCVVGNIGGAFLKGIIEGSVGGGICVAVNIGGAFLNGICGAAAMRCSKRREPALARNSVTASSASGSG